MRRKSKHSPRTLLIQIQNSGVLQLESASKFSSVDEFRLVSHSFNFHQYDFKTKQALDTADC